MLIDFAQQVKLRNLAISGVLHIGAHLAEEVETYYDLGIRNVVWVEGNPDLYGKLSYKLQRFQGNRLIIALIGANNGESVTFNISNYDSMSSSVLEFGTHTEFSPDTVWVDHRELRTRTVDSLKEQHGFYGINTLVMDIQGSELQALQGGIETLRQIDVIYSEVNCDEVYIGVPKYVDLARFLEPLGFFPRMVVWDTHGWGDAIWLKQ